MGAFAVNVFPVFVWPCSLRTDRGGATSEFPHPSSSHGSTRSRPTTSMIRSASAPGSVSSGSAPVGLSGGLSLVGAAVRTRRSAASMGSVRGSSAYRLFVRVGSPKVKSGSRSPISPTLRVFAWIPFTLLMRPAPVTRK